MVMDHRSIHGHHGRGRSKPVHSGLARRKRRVYQKQTTSCSIGEYELYIVNMHVDEKARGEKREEQRREKKRK